MPRAGDLLLKETALGVGECGVLMPLEAFPAKTAPYEVLRAGLIEGELDLFISIFIINLFLFLFPFIIYIYSQLIRIIQRIIWKLACW